MAEPWWKTAVFYQVYPRSFADSNDDGVGDLEGIRRRLAYLERLGVDALWISPFFPSPMADFGYDVSNYCDVDPIFGTLEDFDRLLAEAHERGIRIIIDWVANHTSDQHPWFVESRSSRQSPKRDWYWWRDEPNNWVSVFTKGRAWTYDEGSGQWYLHLFLPEQPDLNWHNPEVGEAMHDTLRFWLDRGVDGFRLDAVHGIGKDPALPDDPPGSGFHIDISDHPAVHRVLKGVRHVTDEYPDDRVLVGEVGLGTGQITRYFGTGDQLHLAFDFATVGDPLSAEQWRTHITTVADQFDAIGAWPTYALSSHDRPRHRTRLQGSEAKARALAVLLLTVRGTPFLYAGEELGLEDAYVPPDRVVDVDGRDPCRAPIPWDSSPQHGWGADPWLPFPPEPDVRNPEALGATRGSILDLYRRLIAARRASPALRAGTLDLLPSPPHVLAYERRAGDDRRRVLVNLAGDDCAVPPELAADAGWITEVASDGVGEADRACRLLAGDTAVVLAPTG